MAIRRRVRARETAPEWAESGRKNCKVPPEISLGSHVILAILLRI